MAFAPAWLTIAPPFAALLSLITEPLPRLSVPEEILSAPPFAEPFTLFCTATPPPSVSVPADTTRASFLEVPSPSSVTVCPSAPSMVSDAPLLTVNIAEEAER